MIFSRLRFSKEASDALNRMKGKVGLTPNILCRIGFNLSLSDLTVPDPNIYDSQGDKEIDRKVLLGAEDELYIALLRERCLHDNIPDDQILDYFKAHMNRGVLLLSKRVGNVKDLGHIIPD